MNNGMPSVWGHPVVFSSLFRLNSGINSFPYSPATQYDQIPEIILKL